MGRSFSPSERRNPFWGVPSLLVEKRISCLSWCLARNETCSQGQNNGCPLFNGDDNQAGVLVPVAPNSKIPETNAGARNCNWISRSPPTLGAWKRRYSFLSVNTPVVVAGVARRLQSDSRKFSGGQWFTQGQLLLKHRPQLEFFTRLLYVQELWPQSSILLSFLKS